MFDELFKDKRIDKISLEIEKLEIMKDCSSVGVQISKKEVMSNPEIGKEIIKKELALIPKLPGVYKMLNSKNEILYVGKAKNLPNRLKSYVSEKNHIIRTERMLSQTQKLEITTTTNESEALLLEANLIKNLNQNLIYCLKMINLFHIYLYLIMNFRVLKDIEVQKINLENITDLLLVHWQ